MVLFQVMMALASHLQGVEAEKQKLRAQVRRLCQVRQARVLSSRRSTSVFTGCPMRRFLSHVSRQSQVLLALLF